MFECDDSIVVQVAPQAPWFALKAIRGELAKQMSLQLEIRHLFARGPRDSIATHDRRQGMDFRKVFGRVRVVNVLVATSYNGKSW